MLQLFLEFQVGERYKLQEFPKIFTNVKNNADCSNKHKRKCSPKLDIFTNTLSERPSCIVYTDHSGLQPPLINKHNRVFEIWSEFLIICKWRIISVDVWFAYVHKVDQNGKMSNELHWNWNYKTPMEDRGLWSLFFQCLQRLSKTKHHKNYWYTKTKCCCLIISHFNTIEI